MLGLGDVVDYTQIGEGIREAGQVITYPAGVGLATTAMARIAMEAKTSFMMADSVIRSWPVRE